MVLLKKDSLYSSLISLVYKWEVGIKTRLCVDFRKLNAINETDAEPLSRVDTFLDKLAEAKVFINLDLASRYWYIPIYPKDSKKFALATTFGLYEWLYLPFGLKNLPAYFNFIILNKYKTDVTCNYFDDRFVFSQDEEEHCEI